MRPAPTGSRSPPSPLTESSFATGLRMPRGAVSLLRDIHRSGLGHAGRDHRGVNRRRRAWETWNVRPIACVRGNGTLRLLGGKGRRGDGRIVDEAHVGVCAGSPPAALSRLRAAAASLARANAVVIPQSYALSRGPSGAERRPPVSASPCVPKNSGGRLSRSLTGT